MIGRRASLGFLLCGLLLVDGCGGRYSRSEDSAGSATRAAPSASTTSSTPTTPPPGGALRDASAPDSSASDASTSMPHDAGPVTCDRCAPPNVCDSRFGCIPACDVAGGLEANAPWPLGGGCATRRALSGFSGAKRANLVRSTNLNVSPGGTADMLTIGANHSVYAPYDAANDGGALDGFAKFDGSGNLLGVFSDWLNEVPVLAANGVRYTMPGGLVASRDDGVPIWTGIAPSNQSGEPVVGNDGTIYAPGTDSESAGLFAVSAKGQTLWRAGDTNTALSTWPAISNDGSIFFGEIEGSRCYLFALAPNGKTRWKMDIGEYVFAYPAVDHDGSVVIGNGPELWAFEDGGGVRFHYTDPDPSRHVFTHVAIAADGSIYASWYGATIEEVGLTAFSSSGEVLWHHAVPIIAGFSAATVDRDGTIFFTEAPGIVALNPDGSQLWSYPASDCSSAAIDSDGTTYFVCGGQLEAFR